MTRTSTSLSAQPFSAPDERRAAPPGAPASAAFDETLATLDGVLAPHRAMRRIFDRDPVKSIIFSGRFPKLETGEEALKLLDRLPDRHEIDATEALISGALADDWTPDPHELQIIVLAIFGDKPLPRDRQQKWVAALCWKISDAADQHGWPPCSIAAGLRNAADHETWAPDFSKVAKEIGLADGLFRGAPRRFELLRDVRTSLAYHAIDEDAIDEADAVRAGDIPPPTAPPARSDADDLTAIPF